MFKVAYLEKENDNNKVRLVDASFYREEGSYTNFYNPGVFYANVGSEPEFLIAIRTGAIQNIQIHKSKKEKYVQSLDCGK